MSLSWGVIVLCTLALMLRGLRAGVYFEPTGEAIAEARLGETQVVIACGMLIALSWYAVRVARVPVAIAGAVLAPMFLSGGLTMFASGTLLPIISVVVAYPLSLAGTAGALLVGKWSVHRPS